MNKMTEDQQAWQRQDDERREEDMISVLTRIYQRCGADISLAAAYHMGYLTEWRKRILKEAA